MLAVRLIDFCTNKLSLFAPLLHDVNITIIRITYTCIYYTVFFILYCLCTHFILRLSV